MVNCLLHANPEVLPVSLEFSGAPSGGYKYVNNFVRGAATGCLHKHVVKKDYISGLTLYLTSASKQKLSDIK